MKLDQSLATSNMIRICPPFNHHKYSVNINIIMLFSWLISNCHIRHIFTSHSFSVSLCTAPNWHFPPTPTIRNSEVKKRQNISGVQISPEKLGSIHKLFFICTYLTSSTFEKFHDQSFYHFMLTCSKLGDLASIWIKSKKLKHIKETNNRLWLISSCWNSQERKKGRQAGAELCQAHI